MVSVTVGAYAAESDVADLLRETEAAHPGVAIGSYPFFKDGRYGANFVIRSEDGDAAQRCGERAGRASSTEAGIRGGRRRHLGRRLRAIPTTAGRGKACGSRSGGRSDHVERDVQSADGVPELCA